jgi:uncharacterized protein YjbI with pentapeptide repeats
VVAMSVAAWSSVSTEAVLTNADLRASIYTGVKFVRTDLRGADMRRGDYEDCLFDGALMDGARMTRAQAARLNLDKQQFAVLAWCADDGPEPTGG